MPDMPEWLTSFFSHVAEGSAFAIGEIIVAVALVAVATAYGMKKTDFYDHIGRQLAAHFPAMPRVNISGAKIRLAVWFFIVGITAWLSWKAFLLPPNTVVQGSTQEQINKKAAEALQQKQDQLDRMATDYVRVQDQLGAALRQNQELSKLQQTVAEKDRQIAALQSQVNVSPQSPPVAAPKSEARNYTHKTVADLMAFYEGRTLLQGDIFMADEVGKWLEAEGKVREIQPQGNAILQVGNHVVNCLFDETWKLKLSAFGNGSIMKVQGQIMSGQPGGGIYLHFCEIQS